MSLTVGSLFSGIGGFDLAAERVGWTIKWQVEIDPYCTKVLEKHWPHVRRYGDIKRLRYPVYVDVICGGFPCQDISVAGKGAGITGKRSGLWKQFDRIISAVRPRYVVVENVPALLARGMGTVLGDLASRGYDAEWNVIPACAVGAPHIRERVWIVAYVNRERQSQPQGCERESRRWPGDGSAAMADSNSERLQERFVFTGVPPEAGCDEDGQDAAVGGWWAAEPDVGRVAHGVSRRVDRLRGLGNAIVPQVAEWILRQIQAYEERREVA